MPGYATGSIAGVALTSGGDNLKCQVIDGGNFDIRLAGTSRRAADGTVSTQILDKGTKGIPFGVELSYAPVSVVSAIVAAIRAALIAGNPFNVTLTDEKHTINASCVWDFEAQPAGPQYPPQRITTSTVKGWTARFLTV